MKDYPQLSIRLPTEMKATLRALSVVTRRPQWRLVAEAIECYLQTRPEPEQRMIADLVDRYRSRGAKRTDRS